MNLPEKLKELAERVDLNLAQNIDLEDVAAEIHTLAKHCEWKVLVTPEITQGRYDWWAHIDALTIPGRTPEYAVANLQAKLDEEEKR